MQTSVSSPSCASNPCRGSCRRLLQSVSRLPLRVRRNFTLTIGCGSLPLVSVEPSCGHLAAKLSVGGHLRICAPAAVSTLTEDREPTNLTFGLHSGVWAGTNTRLFNLKVQEPASRRGSTADPTSALFNASSMVTSALGSAFGGIFGSSSGNTTSATPTQAAPSR